MAESESERKNGPSQVPEGQYVGGGSFRIDRARALEKLERFQFADPTLFLLPWIRSAVAAGATSIVVLPAKHSLAMTFDGLPFARETLEDPYSCLFDEALPELRPARELAFGLLAVLRLNPEKVSIISGRSSERMELIVKSIREESVEALDSPGEETHIHVQGGMRQAFWSDEILKRIAGACVLTPIPIRIGELPMPIPVARDPGPVVEFDENGVRGRLTVPKKEGTLSRVDIYTLGVRAAEIAHEAAIPFAGAINDDRLAINMSQSGVVEDDALRRCLGTAGGQAQALLLAVAKCHSEHLRALGRKLLDPVTREWWWEMSQGTDANEKTEGGGGFLGRITASVLGGPSPLNELSQAERGDMLWTRHASDWLRGIALRLPRIATDARGSIDAVSDALWSVPIQLGIDGRPLSLRDLQVENDRLGYLPVSKIPSVDAEIPFRAAWLTTSRDIALLTHMFPGIREVSDLVSALTRPSTEDLTQEVSHLDASGIADVLVRKLFLVDAIGVEVGLSLIPHESGQRIHIFRGRELCLRFERRSELRFDLAADYGNAPAPKDPRDCEELLLSVLSTIETLYKPLAENYDCWRKTERNAAIRKHLLDYLAARKEKWICSMLLFDGVTDWVSLDALRAAIGSPEGILVAEEAKRLKVFKGRRMIAGAQYTDEFLKKFLPGLASRLLPNDPGVRVLTGN